MTLAELKGFLRAYAKQKADDQISFVVGIAIGAQGDEKSIKKVISSFERAKKLLIPKEKTVKAKPETPTPTA